MSNLAGIFVGFRKRYCFKIAGVFKADVETADSGKKPPIPANMLKTFSGVLIFLCSFDILPERLPLPFG